MTVMELVIKYKKNLLVFAAFAAIGLAVGIQEHMERTFDETGQAARNTPGSGDLESDMTLSVPALEEETEYLLEILEQILSVQDRRALFEKAEQEVRDSFPGENESVDHIEGSVELKEELQDGLVKAEWNFDNYDVMETDGTVIDGGLDPEGTLVTATAELSYLDYGCIVEIPFVVYPKTLTKTEAFYKSLAEDLKSEGEKSGEEDFKLPDKVEGYELEWKEKTGNTPLIFLFLGAVAAVLLAFSERSKLQKQKEERERELLYEYPELISKLSLLLGSGMTVQTAWGRITEVYVRQVKQKLVRKKPAYEEMLITYREIQDGAGERQAYERFGERTGLQQYRKLTSLITQNLKKGSAGLTAAMEKEAEDAFLLRKNLAKKYGEEAGTKLLGPMMLMLFIVMVIVMVPALTSF